jgi:hypothetical protein
MFNLLISFGGWGNGRDTIPANRVFGQTAPALVARFRPNGQFDIPALTALPTLFVEEGRENQIARFGFINRIREDGRNILIDYTYDQQLLGIPNHLLFDNRHEFGIGEWELTNTHWAIKDEDLFRALVRINQPRRQRPRVFQIPDNEAIEPILASAMMPFAAEFNPVYAALQGVCEEVGLRCRRADDIWENPLVMQDVVQLIDRSSVVIADCTGRNPNVFYEVGIAHTLGREVILITQNEADVPFDLRAHRYVRYLNNGEGLAELANRLRPRLQDLAP